MTCPPCQAFNASPTYARHSLGCVYCGARSIQRIQKFRLPPAVIADRCRASLSAWTSYGHAESEIRRLAKSVELCVEPLAGRGKR